MAEESTQKLLEEVSRWKLEAADEDSQRYFYHVDIIKSLESGENSIVIGRKGTGKTAICRYFETGTTHDRFCLKLSFKEFPFNILYKLEDNNYTTPSQYISIWKYFIYNSILKMMSTNKNLNSDFQEQLEKLFPEGSMNQVNQMMVNWTKKSFGAGVLGVSGNTSIDRQFNSIHEIIHDLVPALESSIAENIDDRDYFIVFDELDEDYRNYWDNESRDKYLSLMTSLFKAVSSVRRMARDSNAYIKPIIFLRDDIYDLLTDPDKNKWEDHKIDLSWTRDNLKRMLGFRIARSANEGATSFDFDTNWQNIIGATEIRVLGHRRRNPSPFEYILQITHSRPRDFVRYLRDAARSSLAQGHKKISESTIRGVDTEFSKHLLEELVNEIQGLIPDIRQFLAYIGTTHKQRYRFDDFISLIGRYQKSDDCDEITKEMSNVSIAKILFHFSIIGNAERPGNRSIFRYQRSNLTINPSESLVIHRGLLKSLGLS
tara:strand:+ start:962 stop:2422 length:1461 start_codon:yes stop_codon:yes gene_type:complete